MMAFAAVCFIAVISTEFGGAIGLFDTISNTVAISMYLVGLSETLVHILGVCWS